MCFAHCLGEATCRVTSHECRVITISPSWLKPLLVVEGAFISPHGIEMSKTCPFFLPCLVYKENEQRLHVNTAPLMADKITRQLHPNKFLLQENVLSYSSTRTTEIIIYLMRTAFSLKRRIKYI